ncbi:2931_t:CDS:2 [Acaulospora colombiana]|uniref:2931_t:CDS:1 n=1 Tax=Acaulospora colombiana TaxID=27376 RepID=A0ACA9MT41_9GLOM|nr:2931_t:CDS:2 [Acaulospora colombiana]
MTYGTINESLSKPEVLKPDIAATTSNSALSIPDSIVQEPSKSAQIRQKSPSEQDKTIRNRERGRDMRYKRPSELRSRGTTPRGKTIKFCEIDEQDTEDMSSDGTSVSDDGPILGLNEETGSGSTVIASGSSSASLESINEKENPKVRPVYRPVFTKSHVILAIVDEYDLIPKSGSRPVIVLDDEDQEFIDAWIPEFYVEPEQHIQYPLYSDVLRGGPPPLKEAAKSL